MEQLSDRVLAAARGAWPAVLARLGVPSNLLTARHGPCPGCGGRDRFRFDDRDGNGTFLCSGGGGELVAGNGIELAAHALGVPWAEALKRLADELGLERGVAGARAAPKAPSRPVPEAPAKRQDFSPQALERCVPRNVVAPARVLAAHSPVWPEIPPQAALGHLYQPGEKVLVMCSEFSQGDYGVYVRDDRTVSVYELPRRPMGKAVPAKLPKGAKNGIWFLNQPVSGKWEVSPLGRDADGNAKLTRRSAVNVTSWRYLVVESDEARTEDWLRALVTLPLPIAAIYGSGGRSVHALVRLDAASKAQFDALRDRIAPLLTKIGADPAAMTAVRLTRLPNVLRFGKTGKDGTWEAYGSPRQQKLLFLDPSPAYTPISSMPRRWDIEPK